MNMKPWPEPRDKILTAHRVGPAIIWICAFLIVVSFSSVFVFGLINSSENMFLVTLLILPFFYFWPTIIFYVAHHIWGKRTDSGEKKRHMVAKIENFLNREDVQAVYYQGHMTENKYLVIVILKHATNKYLKCNFLLPIITSTPKKIYFSTVQFSEGVLTARKLLVECLDSSHVDRR